MLCEFDSNISEGSVFFVSGLHVSTHGMFTVTYCICNIVSCEVTEGIMSWKVQLHVVSEGTTGPASAEEGGGKRGLV